MGAKAPIGLETIETIEIAVLMRHCSGEHIHIHVPISQNPFLGPGSWVLDPASWILDPGSWILGPGSSILGPGSWILGPGSWVLDPGSWTSNFPE